MIPKITALAGLLVLSLCFGAQAQQISLGLSPEINLPTGNASNVSGIGFGGSFKAEFGINYKYAITANGGYNLFIGKKYIGSRIPSIEAVPAKLGFKYYPTTDFYVEAQAGAAFHIGNSSRTSLVWSPGFGTRFKTGTANHKIEFGLRYEAWGNKSYSSGNTNLKATNFSFIGLKLGYIFAL
ncbi:hypothetical protein [Pedobacter nanyangensis]|uniref:hypothetical protein n=1 Tax=Pedobacter nanyangensis TaxID=1562389 RepID=UPI000DE27ED5|nr:hypothetical protein [Pedobacter nanyangensis]